MRRSKYGNVRTNGFASKKEARRAAELQLLEKAGEIFDLAFQVPYRLEVNGELIARYVADFYYLTRDGERRVEDSKGVRTRDYVMKRRLMKAIYGIDILET